MFCFLDDSLDAFFDPRSVAILGASRIPGKIGHEILRNLKLSGFDRPIYPINPNARSILGYKTYPDIQEVKDQIDLAAIALPAEMVEQSIRECVASHVKGVIIITSGFSEIGRADLEQKLLEIARPSGMRIVGPTPLEFSLRNAR